uniref:Reverse transcriptase Ty1/copia-type domain-containing protein n=1 Tax=Trichuris muris TaxID=70415 RepID=A0A5S6R2H5_TRIMR
MIVVGSTAKITKQVGMQLNKPFQTKDLGDVKNCLGMQIERETDGSFLLNQRSITDLMLDQHGLLECKPVATPIETGFLSTNDKGKVMLSSTKYLQAIGTLLYIPTVSRPDIADAFGFLSRRVENPTETGNQ